MAITFFKLQDAFHPALAISKNAHDELLALQMPKFSTLRLRILGVADRDVLTYAIAFEAPDGGVQEFRRPIGPIVVPRSFVFQIVPEAEDRMNGAAVPPVLGPIALPGETSPIALPGETGTAGLPPALIARGLAAARRRPELARLARAAWNDRDVLVEISSVLRRANTRDALLAAIDARTAALGSGGASTGQVPPPLGALNSLFGAIQTLQKTIPVYEAQAVAFRASPQGFYFENLAQQARAQLQGAQAQLQHLQAEQNARWNADFEAARQAVMSIFNTPQTQGGLEMIMRFLRTAGEWTPEDVNRVRGLTMAAALDPLVTSLQASGRSPMALVHLQRFVTGLRTPPQPRPLPVGR